MSDDAPRPPQVINHTPAIVTVNPDPLPAVQPVEFSAALLVKLAREIVVELRNEAANLERFRITPEQYAEIKAIPFYQQAVRTFAVEWNEVKSTEERVRLQALTILEDSLVDLGARMNNEKESLSSVTETAKLFAKLGGVGDRQQGQSNGEKFSITINLGDDQTVQITKDITPTVAPPAGAGPLQADAEGASDRQALRQIIEGAARVPALQPIAEGGAEAAPLRIIPEGFGETPEIRPEPERPGTARAYETTKEPT